MNERSLHVILICPQGSGKGTQSELLQKFGFVHVSTGDLIREGAEKGDPAAIRMKEAAARGELAPAEYIIDLVRRKIQGADRVIYDGVPRTVEQAQELDKVVNIDYVIELELGDEEVVKRISSRLICGACGLIYGKSKPAKVCCCGG